MQYLLALAHGCWVVGHGWVDACLEAGHWLPERQYEARVSLAASSDALILTSAELCSLLEQTLGWHSRHKAMPEAGGLHGCAHCSSPVLLELP